MTTSRTLQEVEQFISGPLKKQLREDLRKEKILREGDIECCTYFHLRRRLGSRWLIFSRKYASKTKHFVDLVLFHNWKPRIAIEIKWRRKKISGKDRKSLGLMLSRPHLRKAYFISILPDRKSYVKLGTKKADREKRKLIEIRIGLDWQPARIEQWKKHRRPYTRWTGIEPHA
jgi:hypothetical protein